LSLEQSVLKVNLFFFSWPYSDTLKIKMCFKHFTPSCSQRD